MTRDLSRLPPEYVNLPTSNAYAYEVDDAVLVTMTRILGLCWESGYEQTPPFSSEDLAELTGRSRSALYRHLKQLREMGWIHVDQSGRQIIVRPVTARRPPLPLGEKDEAETVGELDPPAQDEALVQVLKEIGVENPKRAQLASLGIDPMWVRAWHLWSRHPHRRGLTNPVGNVILKLEAGERPPKEFLREAQQQLAVQAVVLESAPLAETVPQTEDDGVPREARELWARALEELRLQMTLATFDTWLRGTRVVAADEEYLEVRVRHAHAVDWLTHRLMPVIKRVVERRTGREIELRFVAEAGGEEVTTDGQGESGD